MAYLENSEQHHEFQSVLTLRLWHDWTEGRYMLIAEENGHEFGGVTYEPLNIVGDDWVHERIDVAWFNTDHDIRYSVADGVITLDYADKSGGWNTINMRGIDAINLYNDRTNVVDFSDYDRPLEIWAGFHHDTITMTDYGDTLTGGGGLLAHGGAGDDMFNLYGGNANGGLGNDTFWISSGTNIAWGDAGNDDFNITGGSNQLNGGDGSDAFRIIGGTNAVWGRADSDYFDVFGGVNALWGGEGNDTFRFDDGINTVQGGAGADSFHLSGGDTTITDFNPSEGDTLAVDANAYGISSYDDLYWGWTLDEDGNDQWLLVANDAGGNRQLIATFENWSAQDNGFDVEFITLDNLYPDDLAI